MSPEDSSSSLDPISILSGSSPVKQTHRISKGPLAPRSRNLTSTSRSMVFNAVGDDGKSPVRIRVTVQEESNSSPGRKSDRNTKTMTIPLKDAEQSSPVKRRSRKKSNDLSMADVTSGSVHKPTPPRRRVTPARNTRPIISEPDDESIHSPLIDLHTGQISTDYGAASCSVTALNTEQHNTHDDHSDYSLSMMEPMGDAQPEDNHVRSQSQDESMWRAMAQRRTNVGNEFVEDHANNGDYSLSEAEEDEADEEEEEDEDDPEYRPMPVPGEMTVLESEEFSMISVDSLSSRQTGESTAVSVSHAKQTKPTSSVVQRLKVNSSYLPSSPPTMPQSQNTPIIDELTPAEPPAIVNAQMNFPPVMTPLRESAVRSGRVLQDIVRSPDPNCPSSRSDNSGRKIFSGFSSGTRRQLHASLQAGARLAEDKSPLEDRIKYLSPSHFTKDPSSHHRLPTPEDHDRIGANKSSSTDTTADIVYPELQAAQHAQVSSNAKPTYDAMSWLPTGRATLISPVSATQTSSGLGIQHSDRSVLDLPDQTAENKSHGPVPVPVEQEGDAMEEEAAAAEQEQEDRDIWQEEASRSFEEEDEPLELVEAPIRPRRSKLPGTWRRESGNNFHYSDSPEPEEREKRTVSGGSSAEDSAIATPPTSDSHYDADDLEDDEDGIESEEAISHASDGDALTPGSDASAQDDDDTGLFWQANMPSVFHRQGRSPMGKEKADISMVSELKPLSSPPKQSTLNMRPVEGRAGKTENSSSALVTPLRKSLLKSSKIRSSPLAQNVSFMSAGTNETDQSEDYDESVNEQSRVSRTQNSSMASDTRQLLGEMATARRRASQAMEDIMQSRQSISQNLATDDEYPTESNLTKSYVENLNHQSPTKITVNFNDSSIMGSSSLLAPRKTYPALFDDVRLDHATAPTEKTAAAVVSPPSPVKLVSRLTNSFWEVIAGTDGSNDTPPQAKALQQNTANSATSSSKLERESTTVPGTNISDDVLRLRRKYGLLPNTQPFTMSHIRTLHRMLISIRQHASASIIPLATPLPATLEPFLNTRRRAGDSEIVIDRKILATVAAFMGLLVPQFEIKRLETLGSWGDEGAKKARGFDSRGRHGSYLAFAAEGTPGQEKTARKAGQMTGEIKGSWVVEVVVGILEKERISRR